MFSIAKPFKIRCADKAAYMLFKIYGYPLKAGQPLKSSVLTTLILGD